LKSNKTLNDLVQQHETRRELLEVFMKVCDAIAYAHSRGVAHLDLKPENIQCDRFGEVLVCDWGLGKLFTSGETVMPELNEELEVSQHQTLYGYVKGSLGYMAPEQVSHQYPKGAHSDIFALGCLLHFILVGGAPFEGEKSTILTATMKVEYQPVQERASDVPLSLCAVIDKALQADPADRYDSVLALQEDIERYLIGFATTAEKPSIVRRVVKFTQRHRDKVALLAGACSVLGLIVMYFIQSTQELERQSKTQELALTQRLEQINEEYLFYETNFLQSQSNFAKKINNATRNVIRSPLNEEHLEDFKKAGVILKKAVDLNSVDQETVALVKEYCLTVMDFAQLSKVEAAYPDQAEDFTGSYANFTSYEYSQSIRPEAMKLRRFFITIANEVEEPVARYYLTRMLKYDSMTRHEKGRYNDIVEALLPLYHQGKELNTELEDRQMLISARGYFSPYSHLEEFSLLSVLDLKKLSLDLEYHFDLQMLDGAKIKTLDLQRGGRLSSNRPIHIAGLEELIIAEDAPGRSFFREAIYSDQNYRIIRVNSAD